MSGNGPNKAASVLAKLKTLAVKEQVDYNLLVTRYVQGRFLYRLSLSPYVKHFILKGGLLLFAWSGLGTRPTRDMDVLIQNMNNDASHMAAVFKDICMIDVNDGVKYHENTVDVRPIQEDDKYMGLRVRFVAIIGKNRQAMQVDIGFGDVVVPEPQMIEYPTLLEDELKPIIRAYSVESVIAEKFEAMIDLGGMNSRLKDFYDIWQLSRRCQFDGNLLCRAVLDTIKNRGTDLSKGKVIFSPDFITDEKQSQWQGFLKRSKIIKITTDFKILMQDLQVFMRPLLDSCMETGIFSKVWLPERAKWCDPINAIKDDSHSD
jgi:predicted nucleotidyltransferase component of viral defense system